MTTIRDFAGVQFTFGESGLILTSTRSSGWAEYPSAGATSFWILAGKQFTPINHGKKHYVTNSRREKLLTGKSI
jgi:hypothetical protein